jgi:hypothetical protein
LLIVLGRVPVGHAADASDIRQLLRVQPGQTCLSADRLAPQVESWLDDAPVAGDVTIVVDGSDSDPRGVRLDILRNGRPVAHRDFAPGPESCDHMHAAVALAIAMALKASRLDERGQPIIDEPAPRAGRWSLAGSGLGTYRLLPVLAPGLELSVRYSLSETFALRLGALGVAALSVQLEEQPEAFRATLVAARADACARRRLAGALHGGICLGLLSGVLHASGAKVQSAQSSNVPAVALAGAAELELELSSRWSIALGLAMTLLLHRVQVGTEDAGGMPVSSRALASPGFALGLGPVYNFE